MKWTTNYHKRKKSKTSFHIFMSNKGKTYNKKADCNTKAGKVFLLQQQGLKDTEVAKRVGIMPENIPQMELTRTYQAFQTKYADKLQEVKKMADVITEHIKIINQDQDKGAKLNAIKLYIDRVEPENTPNQAQQVNIVLK